MTPEEVPPDQPNSIIYRCYKDCSITSDKSLLLEPPGGEASQASSRLTIAKRDSEEGSSLPSRSDQSLRPLRLAGRGWPLRGRQDSPFKETSESPPGDLWLPR